MSGKYIGENGILDNVTGANFQISLYAFGESEKRWWVQYIKYVGPRLFFFEMSQHHCFDSLKLSKIAEISGNVQILETLIFVR